MNGNTARALKEIANTLVAEGLETETVWIGKDPVRGCVACGQCRAKGNDRCVFNDDVANSIIERLESADGIVIGSPTYYGQPNGAFLAVWQRVCFAGGAHVKTKPAASVAVCRRGGGVPSRWFHGGIPMHEYAVRDAERPRHRFAILEHRVWARGGRMRKRRRGDADDAYARPQPRLGSEEPQARWCRAAACR